MNITSNMTENNIKNDLIQASKLISNIKAIDVAIGLGFMNEELLKLTKINCMISSNFKDTMKEPANFENNIKNKLFNKINPINPISPINPGSATISLSPIEAMKLFIRLAENLFLQIKSDDYKNLLSKIELKAESSKTDISISETIEIMILVGTTDLKKGLATKKQKSNIICGKTINSYELAYFCKNCNLIQSGETYGIFCEDCFIPKLHTGHTYEFSMNPLGEGCCDCGDEAYLTKEAFCPNHKSKPTIMETHLFNQYEEKIVKPLLKIILKRFNEIMIKVSDKKLDAQILVHVFQIIKFLYDLENSKWIELLRVSLQEQPKEVVTNHCCHPSSLKDVKEHICTCSIFENLVRSLLYVPGNESSKFISDFFAEVVKIFEVFRIDLFRSYFKVYVDLCMHYHEQIYQLFLVLSQIINQSHSQNIHLIKFLKESYTIYWLPSLDIMQNLINESPFDMKIPFLILTYSMEFGYILHHDEFFAQDILTNPLFLDKYMTIINSFCFYDNFGSRLKKIADDSDKLDAKKIDTFFNFSLIFINLIRLRSELKLKLKGEEDFNSHQNQANKIIYNCISKNVKLIIQDKIKSISELNSVHLTTFRIFGFFLAPFIENLFMDLNSNFNQTSLNEEIIKRFQMQFETNEKEIKDLGFGICMMILKEFQFISELESKFWKINSDSTIDLLNTYNSYKEFQVFESDIFLFQLFVSILDENEILSLFKFYLGDEERKKEVEAQGIEKSYSYYENLLFHWLCLMRNSSSANLLLILCQTPNKIFKTPKHLIPFYEQLIKCLSIVLALKNGKNYDNFSIEMLKNETPSFLDCMEFNEIITGFFINHKIGNNITMSCDNGSLNYLNLFNCHTLADFMILVSNLEALINLKKISIKNFFCEIEIKNKNAKEKENGNFNNKHTKSYELFYSNVRTKLSNEKMYQYFDEFFTYIKIKINISKYKECQGFLNDFALINYYYYYLNKKENFDSQNIQTLQSSNFNESNFFQLIHTEKISKSERKGVIFERFYRELAKLIRGENLGDLEESQNSKVKRDNEKEIQKKMKEKAICEIKAKAVKFTQKNGGLF